MAIEYAVATKFPDKGIPYKYTNIGERWVSTTIFKNQREGHRILLCRYNQIELIHLKKYSL